MADDDGADPRDRAFSVWLNDVEKVIFSRTLDTVDWKNARLADADLVSTVRDLRAQDGGDILVLASASIIRSLLETGDLDGLSLTLCPEIVGGGARLFDDGHTGSSWSVREMTPTESGGISLVYDRLQARP